MLFSNNFRLRLLDEDDLSFVKDLRQDAQTQLYLGTFCFISETTQKDWFLSIKNNNSKKYLIFEKEDAGSYSKIGMVRLTDIDYINSSVCVGGDISPEFRGKGYSKIMYKLIFDLCFNQYNLNRVWLFVLSYNNVALSLYKKLGFTEEGCQRKAIYRNGKYHDYIMMSILKDEYESK
jgi:RimJ/RimL family protein N-acetyltransferase